MISQLALTSVEVSSV